jgi:hypothetical protein
MYMDLTRAPRGLGEYVKLSDRNASTWVRDLALDRLQGEERKSVEGRGGMGLTGGSLGRKDS